MNTLRVQSKHMSTDQKTCKYLWKMEDKNYIESVFLNFDDFYSMCISSQAGCALKCSFCATGLGGIVRDLSEIEIFKQVQLIYDDKRLVDYPKPLEVSFMGMGEPLLNLETVLKSIKLISNRHPNARFSLSTVGIIPKIYDLLKANPFVQLQVSLHATTDAVRQKIIPISKKYPISELLKAIKIYSTKSQADIYINYLLIDGINDNIKCAYELVRLLENLNVYVKISSYNPIHEINLFPAKTERHYEFEQICSQGGLNVYNFESKGIDITAGCGQLRFKKMGDYK